MQGFLKAISEIGAVARSYVDLGVRGCSSQMLKPFKCFEGQIIKIYVDI